LLDPLKASGEISITGNENNVKQQQVTITGDADVVPSSEVPNIMGDNVAEAKLSEDGVQKFSVLVVDGNNCTNILVSLFLIFQLMT
jgi:hypothetical protein